MAHLDVQQSLTPVELSSGLVNPCFCDIPYDPALCSLEHLRIVSIFLNLRFALDKLIFAKMPTTPAGYR